MTIYCQKLLTTPFHLGYKENIFFCSAISAVKFPFKYKYFPIQINCVDYK